MEIKITPALLRRTPKAGRSILFEAVLDGEVIGSRTSGSYNFYGALFGRYNSTDTWSTIGYFGRPDLLEAGKRKALATLKWPKELAVATVATPEQRAAEFSAQYPVGLQVLYRDDHGQQQPTHIRSAAWALQSGRILVKLYCMGAGGHDIDRISPVPEPSNTQRRRNYEKASDLGVEIADYFEALAPTKPEDAIRPRVIGFASKVGQLGYLQHLFNQFVCYRAVRALKGEPTHTWQEYIGLDGEPLAGAWNERDYEREAGYAQSDSARQVHNS